MNCSFHSYYNYLEVPDGLWVNYCPAYVNERLALESAMNDLGYNSRPICTNIYLNGDNDANEDTNIKIFKLVRKYLKDTQRFN